MGENNNGNELDFEGLSSETILIDQEVLNDLISEFMKRTKTEIYKSHS